MKLLQILAAQESLGRVAQMRLPATLTYQLLKYLRQFDAEMEVIHKRREALILEAAGASTGVQVSLQPGTPEHAAFLTGFQTFLDEESSLAPFSGTLETILEVIGKDEANKLSVQDLSMIEPFFQAAVEK